VIASILAELGASGAQLAVAAVGVVTLYAAQFAVARLRRHALLHGAFDNAPLLLMDADRILDDNLAAARLTHDDLHGKLREANVLHYGQVRAVVFETTGEVSVLHGDDALDPALLRGVRWSPSGGDRER
jgi:uncharacterized membrane protein YcaP (DUF421 family)